MKRRRVTTSAFTLIELIIVLVLLGIMVAVVAPSFSGFGQRQKLQNAADDLVAATGYARSEAVTQAHPYAMQIDTGANSYSIARVGPNETRTPVPGPYGKNAELPTDYKLTLTKGGSANGGTVSIVFYPDGRVTPATIEIRTPSGQTVVVASDNPAEPFHRLERAS